MLYIYIYICAYTPTCFVHAHMKSNADNHRVKKSIPTRQKNKFASFRRRHWHCLLLMFFSLFTTAKGDALHGVKGIDLVCLPINR